MRLSTAPPASVLDENHSEKSPGPKIRVPDNFRRGELFASRFELRSELENSRTGAVWLARDYSVQRQAGQVALKFLPEFIVSDKAAVELLKKEVSRRFALKHPSIRRVYDLVEDDGRVAIQMEYLDGQSLSRLRLAKPNQIFEVRDLEKWVKQLCTALEYAHEDFGIISGDISPDNLILDPTGSLKIKDFGIEQCISDSMGRLVVIPDPGKTLLQNRSDRTATEKPTVSDDVYLLGATVYELLTGKPPFSARELSIQLSERILPSVTDRRVELGIGGESIPKNWEETVAACLARDPVRRPKSAINVARQLEITTPSDIPNRTRSTVQTFPDATAKPQSPVRAPATRNPWLVLTGIVVTLTSLSTIALFSFHHSAEPKPGKFVLNATPAKTNVLLEGISRKTTPLVLKDVAPTVLPSPSAGTAKEEPLAVGTPSPEMRPIPTPQTSPTPGVSPTPPAPNSETPEVSSMASPQVSVTDDEFGSASLSSTSVSQHDLDAIKEDVKKRINLAPGLSAKGKANLVEKMQRARSMERLAVIPFDRGEAVLPRAAIDELVKTLDKPEMRDKLSDPTTVLVIAGYADTGGRADLNLRISRERAEKVTKILKDQAKLLNPMQTIGMGGTELFDTMRPEQNRAVEVWAVVPF
jgi:serine/threonine protein kinase